MKTLAQVRKIDANSPDSEIIAAAHVASLNVLSAMSETGRLIWEREADRLAPLAQAAFQRSCEDMRRACRDIQRVCAA